MRCPGLPRPVIPPDRRARWWSDGSTHHRGAGQLALSRPGVDPRVRRVQELTAADPAARHAVRSLAAGVALSPFRFAHVFTQQLGRSPMRALREVRPHTEPDRWRAPACPWNAWPPLPVVSPFHCDRAFREGYGMAPGAYRAGGPMVGT
jgi:AraC family transcriptional regulator of arabinose operon